MKATVGQQAKARLDMIKSGLKLGQLSFDDAKQMAKEPLQILNQEMEKIAKQFKRKHRAVVFTSYMR